MRNKRLLRSAGLAVGVVAVGAAVWLLLPRRPAPSPAGPAADLKLPARWRPDEPVPKGWERHPYPRGVQLTADGRRLAVAWGSGVRVWDLPTGRAVTPHDDRKLGVNNPTLSPDGRWVVGFRGSEPVWQLVIWDAATGKEVHTEPEGKRSPKDHWRPEVLGIDPSGAAWVVRSGGPVERLELPSGKITRTIPVPFDGGPYGRLILSPGGDWLALGGRLVFAVCRTESGKGWVVVERHLESEDTDCLPQPNHCPVPCGFTPDGRRLVTFDHKGDVVAVWRMGAPFPAKVVSVSTDLPDSDLWTHFDELAFSPGGERFAFVLTPRYALRRPPQPELRVWDIDTLAEVGRVAPPGGVEGLACTPDGRRLVLAQPDGRISAVAAPGW